jgi:hypothetical protein
MSEDQRLNKPTKSYLGWSKADKKEASPSGKPLAIQPIVSFSDL